MITAAGERDRNCNQKVKRGFFLVLDIFDGGCFVREGRLSMVPGGLRASLTLKKLRRLARRGDSEWRFSTPRAVAARQCYETQSLLGGVCSYMHRRNEERLLIPLWCL
jgi:hypothetical protein